MDASIDAWPREAIQRVQNERLRALIDAIVPDNAFYSTKFEHSGIGPRSVRVVDDIHRLPLTTKAELVADQTAHPPYGTNLTFPLIRYSRYHQTSGTTGRPYRVLDTPESWSWFADCWSLIYRMAGLTKDDRIFFPFSFGPFIGFWAAFDGGCRLGNLCIPGGGLSTEARLDLMASNDATFVCCTPTYALRMAEVAESIGFNLKTSAVRALIVAGEPGGNVPATKARIEGAWGATVYDHWGMSELGSLAAAAVGDPEGLYLLETECIAEILNPETLEPVDVGDMGELVVTNLGRIGFPVIRYRTGDLVKASRESPLGYPLLRLEGGILGRADDMITIRGNNVFPSSVEAILREFDEIVEFRLNLETRNSMHHLRLEIEPQSEAAVDALLPKVRRTIKDRLNFQAEVAAVAPGSLPRFELKGRRLVKDDG
ncbi:phenylacetate--CoA ligase family protein [Stratiformator vulcanicus]|uniref:Phenylacetate-coenzyme A ligase n=1 Tax=Stratiformator vulcanicus TaxID=2527980 RepID=A0A517R6S9_9PLAN|nr:AMP-binding protein [Stratiformator vulcanicus]QDT39590.1 Phenylacetate-coenzyme A ligase [Stratiformator vulcanicus]